MLDNDFQDKILFEFNKLIAYLNKNSGAIGLIIAILIPIFSVVGKTLYYSYLYGYGQYFNISIHNIEISDNIFYSIFVSSIFTFIFFGISMIPYFIYKSNIKNIYKIIIVFILFIITFIIYCFFKNLNIFKELYKIKYLNYKEIFLILYYILLFDTVFYIVGVLFILGDFLLIFFKKNLKNNLEQIEKNLFIRIIIFIIFVLIYCLICMFLGYNIARIEGDFKIIEKDNIKYAIIYEDYQKYIITECEIINNNQNFELILKDINEKQNVDKNGIKYKQLNFNKVIKK